MNETNLELLIRRQLFSSRKLCEEECFRLMTIPCEEIPIISSVRNERTKIVETIFFYY